MVTADVTIGGRHIGDAMPVYVIAEAGVNHNGSVDLAHELIDAASSTGADAIKFQTFDPKALVVSGAATAKYQEATTGLTDQKAMLEALCLPTEAWPELASHAASVNLQFLSTPFDHDSIELLLDLGVEALKISSGDLTNHALLRSARGSGLPLLLSTGTSHLWEVSEAVEALGGGHNLVLFHCVTAYPSPIGESNLRAIETLRDEIDCVVGWSDHSVGATTAVAAVALGAHVLEKHLTLDNNLPGPDHAASADVASFSQYVAAVREAESALGDGVKVPQPSEMPNTLLARRGLYATRDLAVGSELGVHDVVALRPQRELPASVAWMGRTLPRSIRAGEPLEPGDLQ